MSTIEKRIALEITLSSLRNIGAQLYELRTHPNSRELPASIQGGISDAAREVGAIVNDVYAALRETPIQPEPPAVESKAEPSTEYDQLCDMVRRAGCRFHQGRDSKHHYIIIHRQNDIQRTELNAEFVFNPETRELQRVDINRK